MDFLPEGYAIFAIKNLSSNRNKLSIKTICTVLGTAKSATYHKSFDKTKSEREVENEILKGCIKIVRKYIMLLRLSMHLV